MKPLYQQARTMELGENGTLPEIRKARPVTKYRNNDEHEGKAETALMAETK